MSKKGLTTAAGAPVADNNNIATAEPRGPIEGNWGLVGNNTPVFYLRDPLKFPDLNHVVKRDPRTNLHNV